MPGADPNNSLEKFAVTVTVYPRTPDDTAGDSVWGDDMFGVPYDVEIPIRPADALPFSIAELGQTNEGGERLVADVPTHHTDDVDTDDSIDYDGRAWRVTERQYANRNDIERYRLIPDTRRAFGEQN